MICKRRSNNLHTNLKCDATRCIHNNSNYCYAGRISIDGRLADDIDDTYCSTFSEKAYQQFTSSICGDNKLQPITTHNIKCAAVKCKFNENKICKSDEVKINSGNASCNMFVE